VAKVFPIQNRFTAGELSPKLHSRSDIEGYASGVKTLSNFVALRHGSIERRDGTKIVSIHDGYRGRMFEFPISETESYAVALTNQGKVYVDDRQGNIFGNNFGTNPDFLDDLTGWTDASTGLGHVDFVDGQVLMGTGGVGASDAAILLQTAVISNPGEQHLMHVEASSLTGATGLTIKLGASAGASNFLQATMAVGETDLYFDLSSALAIRATSGADTRVTSDGDIRVTSGTTFYVQVELDGNGESEEAQWMIDHISFHERTGTHVETEMTHPYDVHDLEHLQMEMEPGENKAHFTTGRKIPHTLDYNAGSWTFAHTAFNARPASWNGNIDFESDDGSQTPNIGVIVEILAGYAGGGTVGNVYRYKGAETDLGATNYASGWTDLGVADLYEETISYDTDGGTRFIGPGVTVEVLAGYAGGGTVGRVYQWPGTINLSTVNYATNTDWDDRGTVAAYSANPNFPGSVGFFGGRSWWAGFPETQDTFNGSRSAAYIDLDKGAGNDDDAIENTLSDHGLIQWIRGEQDLLIGSKNGEYIVTAEGGVITPSDIQVHKQSANGSHKMQGEPIGNSVAYTSLDGSKIRDMEYKFVVNGWQSLDISFTAEHMFQEYGSVKEIHYAKDPEAIIWFVTDSGNLIGCTFDPANNVIGWHRHPTDGKVISACVQRHKGIASLWMMIDRHIGATKKLYIERMTSDAVMDSSTGIYYQAATTAIQGFSHLAGKTVNVKVDGVAANDVTLDSSGDGTASLSGNLIEVGLAYTALLETLPTDVPVEGGTGMGHMKRWNRVFARLYESYLPKINGTRVVKTEPFTGDIDAVKLGWDTDAINTIEMELPYKCKVSGIFGELEENRA
jgi:hypothetical protein